MYSVYLSCFLCFAASLYGDVAPQSVERQVKNLAYTLTNQEQELAFIKERLESLQTIVEAEAKESSRLVQQAKESIKKTVSSSDTQLQTTGKNIEKLVSDLQAFKKQANELTQEVLSLQKHVKEKDEVLAQHAASIKELEHAMRLLASAMQAKTTQTNSNVYEVKSGDTLGKIAKEHNTTRNTIKQLNNLQNDTIYPGQKLTIRQE